ncbi:hypothetical protein BC835DRAFT_538280 [Cytidiella melzeri]|nr:hypothetical protein BC835DRAFT_538280 [Cytidiella melzeri]
MGSRWHWNFNFAWRATVFLHPFSRSTAEPVPRDRSLNRSVTSMVCQRFYTDVTTAGLQYESAVFYPEIEPPQTRYLLYLLPDYVHETRLAKHYVIKSREYCRLVIRLDAAYLDQRFLTKSPWRLTVGHVSSTRQTIKDSVYHATMATPLWQILVP